MATNQAGEQARPLMVGDALSYLDFLKSEFTVEVYNTFLDIMKSFKNQELSTAEVVNSVQTLFSGHREALQGFSMFLPPGYPSLVPASPASSSSSFNPIPAFLASNAPQWPTQSGDFASHGGLAAPHMPPNMHGVRSSDNTRGLPTSTRGHVAISLPTPPLSPGRADDSTADLLGESDDSEEGVDGGGEVNFEDAIGYINTVKQLYGGQSSTYRRLLDVLDQRHAGNMTNEEVYAEVCRLFHEHPFLIQGFHRFLPEDVRERIQSQSTTNGVPQRLFDLTDAPLPVYSVSPEPQPFPSQSNDPTRSQGSSSMPNDHRPLDPRPCTRSHSDPVPGNPPAYQPARQKRVSFSEPIVAGAQAAADGGDESDEEGVDILAEFDDSEATFAGEHIEGPNITQTRNSDQLPVDETSPLLCDSEVTVDGRRNGGQGAKYRRACTACRTIGRWSVGADLEAQNADVRGRLRNAVIVAVVGWGLLFVVVGCWVVHLI
ncbi:Transcriptional regulatory protein sin3 [Rhizophlyctis rosea]|nr:Transcriptional regulatory protein sin3 [Rhizophlyctis rosea]